MLVSRHVIISTVFILAFSYLNNFSMAVLAIIFASSILIDFDHYLFYVWRKKDFSLVRAYEFYMNMERPTVKSGIMIFHTIEFFIFVLLISFALPWVTFILAGMLLHIGLDIYDMKLNKDKRVFSFVKYLVLKIKYPERYL